MGSKINYVRAREILDSRGNPTVEVQIHLSDGAIGFGRAPSGASTGSLEALELRDGDPKRYNKKGVLKAVANVNDIIAKEIVGMQSYDQKNLDHCLIDLDSTKNKSKLGANAILATSIAYLTACANSKKLMVCEYLNPYCEYMPVPMINVINGGAHADNALDIQEFMIAPTGMGSFKEALRCGAEIFHNLKALLKKDKLSTNVGDEGGFAPYVDKVEIVLDYLIKAIELTGYKPGEDVFLALDVAATEFYKQGKYHLQELGTCDASKLIKFYENLVSKYPIYSIEDAFAEDDYDGWHRASAKLNQSLQMVGDDVFVTNLNIFKKMAADNIANAILIKPNQIGTITETLEVVKFAQTNNYNCIISHRSGETEDVTIAHLAVATGVKQIKTGSISRVDRIAKYNELLRIEEKLGQKARYTKIIGK